MTVHDFSLLSGVGSPRRRASVSDRTKRQNPQVQPHLIYLQDIGKGDCYLMQSYHLGVCT